MSEHTEDRLAELTSMARGQELALLNFAASCLNRVGFRPQPADLEDILSDAYLQAATRLTRDTSLTVRRMDAWFRRVLLFVCLRSAAKKQRNRLLLQFVGDLAADDSALDLVSNSQTSPELFASVKDELERLPERERRVIELAAEGYTSQETGEVLALKPDAARQLKSRVLAKLRERFRLP